MVDDGGASTSWPTSAPRHRADDGRRGRTADGRADGSCPAPALSPLHPDPRRGGQRQLLRRPRRARRVRARCSSGRRRRPPWSSPASAYRRHRRRGSARPRGGRRSGVPGGAADDTPFRSAIAYSTAVAGRGVRGAAAGRRVGRRACASTRWRRGAWNPMLDGLLADGHRRGASPPCPPASRPTAPPTRWLARCGSARPRRRVRARQVLFVDGGTDALLRPGRRRTTRSGTPALRHRRPWTHVLLVLVTETRGGTSRFM